MRTHRIAVAALVVASWVPARQGAAQVAPGATLTLERAIATALTQSRVLSDANWGLHAADGAVREAWAGVMPEVRSFASYERNFRVQEAFLPAQIFDPGAPPNELVPVRFGADNVYQAGITLRQPLFEYGVFIGVGAAARYRELEEERVRGTAQSIVTTVRRLYLDVLLRQEEVRLTEQSVTRVRKTLDETTALNRAGLSSDYDVLRLEVQLANLEPTLRRSRDGVAAAKRALAVDLGMAADAAYAVSGTLHELQIAEPGLNTPDNAALLVASGPAGGASPEYEQALQTAMSERSDLEQLRLTGVLERARLSAERADYFPKLSVFSNYTLSAQDNGSPTFFGDGPNRRTTGFSGGLRVELPIFTGFSQDARIQQARSAVRQSEARLEQSAALAANQIQTMLEAADEARQRAVTQARAVEQARRGFDIASAEYRAGVGSQLQITDAEVALRQSEFNYAQAAYDYLIARAGLDAAMGTTPVRAHQATQAGSQ